MQLRVARVLCLRKQPLQILGIMHVIGDLIQQPRHEAVKFEQLMEQGTLKHAGAERRKLRPVRVVGDKGYPHHQSAFEACCSKQHCAACIAAQHLTFSCVGTYADIPDHIHKHPNTCHKGEREQC